MKIQLIHHTETDRPSEIHTFMQCGRCLRELPLGTSPAEWARLNVGLTPTGLQVWCVRHDLNVSCVEVSLAQ